jgi:hypothetical protein
VPYERTSDARDPLRAPPGPRRAGELDDPAGGERAGEGREQRRGGHGAALR